MNLLFHLGSCSFFIFFFVMYYGYFHIFYVTTLSSIISFLFVFQYSQTYIRLVGCPYVATAHNNTHVKYIPKKSQDFLLIVSALRIIFFDLTN
jgi:hypothetical protein